MIDSGAKIIVSKSSGIVLLCILFAVAGNQASYSFAFSLVFSILLLVGVLLKSPQKIVTSIVIFLALLFLHLFLNQFLDQPVELFLLRAAQVLVPFSLVLARVYGLLKERENGNVFLIFLLFQSISTALTDNYLTADNTNSAYAYVPVVLMGMSLKGGYKIALFMAILSTFVFVSWNITLISVALVVVAVCSALLIFKDASILMKGGVVTGVVVFAIVLAYLELLNFGFSFEVTAPLRIFTILENLLFYLDVMWQGGLAAEGSISRRLMAFPYLFGLIVSNYGMPLGLGYTSGIAESVLGVGSFHNSILVFLVEFGLIPTLFFFSYFLIKFKFLAKHWGFIFVVLISSLSLSDNFFSNTIYWISVVCFFPKLELRIKKISAVEARSSPSFI